MEKREEILLCISRLAAIGAEAGIDASVICNAIDLLAEYSTKLHDEEMEKIE